MAFLCVCSLMDLIARLYRYTFREFRFDRYFRIKTEEQVYLFCLKFSSIYFNEDCFSLYKQILTCASVF